MNKKYYSHHFINKVNQISLNQILQENRNRKKARKQKLQAQRKIEQIQKKYPYISKEKIGRISEVVFSDHITPQRFVYHLAKSTQRASIAKFGLEVIHSQTKAIYANNQHISKIMTFFPFCLYEGDPLDLDIWQIDTTKVKPTWRIDPFMGEDDRYICTPDNVPPTALRLFKAVATNASTTNQNWMILGSLDIHSFRFVEHLPTARLMDYYHYIYNNNLKSNK